MEIYMKKYKSSIIKNYEITKKNPFFLPCSLKSLRSILKVALQIFGRNFYKNTKKIIVIVPNPFDFHS